MRILVSIENEKGLDKLCASLAGVLSMLEDDELYVDILHVYEPVEGKMTHDMVDKIEEIKKDEKKAKIRFLSTCENNLEKYLQDNLDKTALVNSFLLEGDYKKTIEKHIIFQTYSLLVLIPREKVNFNEILTGRNTHWVIDNLEVPVLLLPRKLERDPDHVYHMTCFVDIEKTYRNVKRSEFISKIKPDRIEYVHFGRHEVDEGVKVINSSNVTESLQEHTANTDANNIYVLVHKNKGDFLNFLNKSFTKSVISTLHNPLLIF